MKPAPVLFLSIACLAAACVQIDGGAVEISWVIRSQAGSAITDCGCADPEIAQVRLLLQGVDAAGNPIPGTAPCAGQAQCDFPCARQTGSTAFNIPETHGGNRYRVSLEAVGTNGVPLTPLQVQAPAPILRDVVRGQPTEVASMELVAGCATECQMNSSGVCSRP
jgi:hypothetical protein